MSYSFKSSRDPVELQAARNAAARRRAVPSEAPIVSECAALREAARTGDSEAVARSALLYETARPDRNARRRAARAAIKARAAAERDVRLTEWLTRALPWERGRNL